MFRNAYSRRTSYVPYRWLGNGHQRPISKIPIFSIYFLENRLYDKIQSMTLVPKSFISSRISAHDVRKDSKTITFSTEQNKQMKMVTAAAASLLDNKLAGTLFFWGEA